MFRTLHYQLFLPALVILAFIPVISRLTHHAAPQAPATKMTVMADTAAAESAPAADDPTPPPPLSKLKSQQQLPS